MVSLVPRAGWGQFVAEQVTTGNAAIHLFGGSDAFGGIGDWYLSNGVIEAIIDDVGPQEDLIPLLGASAPPKQNVNAATGGTVLDLGLVGRNNDQIPQIYTIGGLIATNYFLAKTISATVGVGEATITVTGGLAGFDPIDPDDLAVVTEYRAAGTDPFLTLTTTVTNHHPTETAAGLGGLIDVFAWSNQSIIPFSPLVDRGFSHRPGIVGIETPAYVAGPGNITPADGIMDPPSGTTAGEVAYGLLGVEISIDQDGQGVGNPPVVTPVDLLFGPNSKAFTAMGNFPVGDLGPGGVLRYTRRVYVGGRNDVASVANAMITEIATRTGFGIGTISRAGGASGLPASVIATKTGGAETPGFDVGAPVTQFRTDANGDFLGVVLPVGTYDLEFRAFERDPVNVTDVTVSTGLDTPVPFPAMSDVGTVVLMVHELLPGPDPLVPGRITFKGIDGTPDPRFRKDYEAFLLRPGQPPEDVLPEAYAGGPAQQNYVILADGTASVELRPGRYELFASRGPEYSVHRRRLSLRAGQEKKRRFRLRKLVDTTGALSADFHVHSAKSYDSAAPLRDRLAGYACEGVEVVVATDHDYQVDYSPFIEELGIGSYITSMVGAEATGVLANLPIFPEGIGHINAWPMQVEPLLPRDGAIQKEYVAPNFVFSRLRAKGAQVVQYNHPRTIAGPPGGAKLGFFNNIGYDPDLPIDTSPNDLLLSRDITGVSSVWNPDGFRNIDFDVIEVANRQDLVDYLATRRDWFSLLNQTNRATVSGTVPFIPGTAVSDSHHLSWAPTPNGSITGFPGYFRTYVRGSGDDPSSLDTFTFNENVRSGNMVGSNGPYIEFSVESSGGGETAGLGETLAATDVILHIRVQASNWIPVEEVRVIANGSVLMSFDETTSPQVKPPPRRPWYRSKFRVVRFEAAIPVTPAADTYFLVEAGAKLSPLSSPPEFVEKLVPNMVPLAFTNPIFVDTNGGGFDPPGLPVMASVDDTDKPLSALAHQVQPVEYRGHACASRVRFEIPQSVVDEVRSRLGHSLRRGRVASKESGTPS
jgi:hypothetical protein